MHSLTLYSSFEPIPWQSKKRYRYVCVAATLLSGCTFTVYFLVTRCEVTAGLDAQEVNSILLLDKITVLVYLLFAQTRQQYMVGSVLLTVDVCSCETHTN